MNYDVVIVGGGPRGLSAALALGRARKRVLLCDSGAPRNEAAEHVYNFLTRDGTPPAELRGIGREQLSTYPSVEVRDARVTAITGEKGAFEVTLTSDSVSARRVLLSTGMRDELLPIEGFAELWGSAIFQCPYCHGWETRDRKWGYLVRAGTESHLLPFALMARGWTEHVTVFTGGAFPVSSEDKARLESAGITLRTEGITRLVRDGDALEAVELEGGTVVPCDVIYAHPAQSQVDLVESMGVALEDGYVTTSMMGETSIPGVYAAGDLTSARQAAVKSAAAGMGAGAAINVDLAMEFRVQASG